MKAKTKTITAIEMTVREHSYLNAVACIFDDICFGDDKETKKAIETEWKNEGLNFGIEDIINAFNILCDLTDEVVAEE